MLVILIFCIPLIASIPALKYMRSNDLSYWWDYLLPALPLLVWFALMLLPSSVTNAHKSLSNLATEPMIVSAVCIPVYYTKMLLAKFIKGIKPLPLSLGAILVVTIFAALLFFYFPGLPE